MGAKINGLGLILYFPPISEVCDGTVSLILLGNNGILKEQSILCFFVGGEILT